MRRSSFAAAAASMLAQSLGVMGAHIPTPRYSVPVRTVEPPVKKKRFTNPERMEKVDRLTNWQRTQWARAGYKDDRIEEFGALVRLSARSAVILMAMGRI